MNNGLAGSCCMGQILSFSYDLTPAAVSIEAIRFWLKDITHEADTPESF
jgi:hypothetical protein